MQDPVFTIDGQTYERSAISAWLEEHSTAPATGVELTDKTLVPNYALQSVVEETLTQHPEIASHLRSAPTTPVSTPPPPGVAGASAASPLVALEAAPAPAAAAAFAARQSGEAKKALSVVKRAAEAKAAAQSKPGSA
eukprot:7386709-Prymnesium_polylepis.1